MRIGIVGGGPAGLYFALLMKRLDPAHQITVVEQNSAEATYGWGVVFSDRALGFLVDTDPELFAELQPRLQTWDDQQIVHRGQRVTIDGLGFSAIARLELLRLLRRACQRRGVALELETRLEDPARFADCDLLVGADGVNSVVREAYRQEFQPTIATLTNRYIWYGTRQRFAALTLTFRQNADGAFVAHHYRHGPDTSTFIVECDAATWERAGFAALDEPAVRRYCERLFAADLGGQPLLPNRPVWLSFRVVSNRRWSYRNVVLLGDALRSVHFSIGSGTRTALEDAIALAGAFRQQADVPAALAAFEAARRPAAERFLAVANRSAQWYERFAEHLALEPLPFAYSYLTRGGQIDAQAIAQRSPRFFAAYQAAGSARSWRRDPA